MKYQVSQVKQWGEELDALPAPEPGSRMVGKREAVLLLAEKLQSAARRGVSREALLDALEAKGLKVHIDLLREALKHAGKAAGQRPPRAGKKARGAGSGSKAEGAEKSGATAGPGAGDDSERGPVVSRSSAGGTAGSEAGGPSEESPEATGTERRGDEDDATALEPTGTAERFGGNLGEVSAPATAAPPAVPLKVSKEPKGAGADSDAARAPGPQAKAVGPPQGAEKAAAPARAEPTGPSARQGEAGARGDGTAGTAPAARGSFVPRSDSDII